MNRSALKKYAPQARLDFIEAVTMRARRLGLDPALPVSVEQTGDVLLIGGQPFPASIAKQHMALAQRIQQQGFSAVVEALAYTWFNRLVAIRFMELKGYLSHGYRVLSHPQGQQPEILDHVQHLDLPGLDKAEVIRLKTAGNKDEALYREILLAQCHELHRYMPFLFEALDDATELLLPDNLLRTDSPIANLVSDIDEADWQEVEVIGWLYQFYISDKKNEVIGKVVKSEDIPAATQLFTPNWIVQYLVQNSVGRLWLMANPGSTLASEWPYYIQPAEQTPEVQAQLDALIQTRMDEDGGSLNPESITVLDPACGSGHILVVAYDVLKAIYLERGYQARAIPRLILEKNLYGLDIDDRAAQMAGFALLMKARADDRRLFNEPPKFNVLSLQESKGLDAAALAQAINAGGTERVEVAQFRWLIDTFEHAKTFGSLIQIGTQPASNLRKLLSIAQQSIQTGDLYAQAAAQDMLPLVQQSLVLGMQFDAVVANPPYMGGKGLNPVLKEFAQTKYPGSKSDLFAMFIERGFEWGKATAFNSMITMQNWMFLSSYEVLRSKLLSEHSLLSLIQLPYDGKQPTAMGINFGVAATNFQKWRITGYRSSFDCHRYFELTSDGVPLKFPSGNERNVLSVPDYFQKLPGSPVAYWVTASIQEAFGASRPLSELLQTRLGMSTADNDRFLRLWPEVSIAKIGFGMANQRQAIDSNLTWFPYQKGGVFRKWYGNCEYVVNWRNDGQEVKGNIDDAGRVRSHNYNGDFAFSEGVTWSDVTSGANAFRFMPSGFLFDGRGSSGFSVNHQDLMLSLGILNSRVSFECIAAINPTIAVNVGEIGKIPLHPATAELYEVVASLADEAVGISKTDWDSFEQSWDFEYFPLLSKANSLSAAWAVKEREILFRIERMHKIETTINRLLVKAYNVADVVNPEVPESKITLARADRGKDCQRLISYAIGCMMGRYSLDEPGLIYAHAGNVGFNASRYASFPADTDGIIPITDESWFEDDAAERVREFVKVVWGAETHVENMEWLADCLGRKAGESADEAIRRYLSTSFYKDHLQTYKKRPIYWLFSSGKQKAFECLVYLHRYNEGTLSRMRMEYVVPLQSRIQARIDKLTDDIDSATSSAQQKALQKRKDKLTKQLEELRRFDENLRPYADQRITLDLDDGVKVNYGKFGSLLAEVKAITGGKEE